VYEKLGKSVRMKHRNLSKTYRRNKYNTFWAGANRREERGTILTGDTGMGVGSPDGLRL
jgi:hypothetical protein